MSYHLIDVVERLGSPKILVLGDLILDKYIWGDAERISQEAPVILLREQRQEYRLGGAANVANMLRGLDARVTMAGAVGQDGDAFLMRAELESAGVDCVGLTVDPERPTTVKERFLGRAQHRHPHQMLRVDRETRQPLSDAAADALLKSVLPGLGDHQAVLISDYAKGVCTPKVVRAVIDAARKAGVPVIVDPASSGDCRNYVGATAITPNRLETSRAIGRDVETTEDAFSAGRRLCAEFELEYAFITLDSEGIALVRADGRCEMLPTRKREVYDITGAGDMVLATIGVGAAAGVDPTDLAKLANTAGGLEVEQVGVVAVSRDEILADLVSGGRQTHEKIANLDQLERQVRARQRLGQRVVFTNGCFDLLHPGHVQFLEEARSHGDLLVVAVNSDAGVRRHKGPQRPVIDEHNRALMLAALECVDHVTVFEEDTPHTIIERLKPEMLVKGGTTPVVVAQELVESYGGQVLTLATVPNFSTSDLLREIRRAKAA